MYNRPQVYTYVSYIRITNVEKRSFIEKSPSPQNFLSIKVFLLIWKKADLKNNNNY